MGPIGPITAILAIILLNDVQQAEAKALPDVLGATHVAGRYYLTDKDFLNEGADQVLALGSRVIKVWFYGKRHEHPMAAYAYNSRWPNVDSLVAGAQIPYFKQLFSKPFTTYIMVVTSLGRDDGYWRHGITDEQKRDEQRQFYELTKHLLTEYKGTGKTFVLQHWEGDWMIRGNYNAKAEPTPLAIRSMIDWLNARQAGVNQARQEAGEELVSRAGVARVPPAIRGQSLPPTRSGDALDTDAVKMTATRGQGVHVYHATEVNLVVQSMRNGSPGVTTKVLPHTPLDLVSYSAWDSATSHYSDPNVLRDALDFIAANAPDSAAFGSHNVYLGEFGMPENNYSLAQLQTAIPNAVQTALKWGCPYIVYWQLYCNELKDPSTKPPVKTNDAVRGFWLIRPDGTKSWTWDYLQGLLTTDPAVPTRP